MWRTATHCLSCNSDSAESKSICRSLFTRELPRPWSDLRQCVVHWHSALPDAYVCHERAIEDAPSACARYS